MLRDIDRSILILHETVSKDARADAADTLVQAKSVAGALQDLGWNVTTLEIDLELETMLAAVTAAKPACVFNLVESLRGVDRLIHIVPSVLSAAGIRYTGADSDAMYLSSNKLLAKSWMQMKGIPTPACFVPGEDKPQIDANWIVKSVTEHASFGLDDGSVVRTLAAARARIDHCRAQHGGEWFAEQFIDGREFNVSVLEVDHKPHILPIAEMTFVDYPRGKPKIVGYAAKWDDHAPEFHATQRSFPGLPGAERDAIVEVVRNCWECFQLRGYARVDLRIDAAGVPWVLEVNVNPCLSPDAGFVAALAEAGMTTSEGVGHIINAALR